MSPSITRFSRVRMILRRRTPRVDGRATARHLHGTIERAVRCGTVKVSAESAGAVACPEPPGALRPEEAHGSWAAHGPGTAGGHGACCGTRRRGPPGWAAAPGWSCTRRGTLARPPWTPATRIACASTAQSIRRTADYFLRRQRDCATGHQRRKPRTHRDKDRQTDRQTSITVCFSYTHTQ